jgi:hypothetical protein
MCRKDGVGVSIEGSAGSALSGAGTRVRFGRLFRLAALTDRVTRVVVVVVLVVFVWVLLMHPSKKVGWWRMKWFTDLQM